MLLLFSENCTVFFQREHPVIGLLVSLYFPLKRFERLRDGLSIAKAGQPDTRSQIKKNSNSFYLIMEFIVPVSRNVYVVKVRLNETFDLGERYTTLTIISSSV